MYNLGQTVLSMIEFFSDFARYFKKCNTIWTTCASDKIGQIFKWIIMGQPIFFLIGIFKDIFEIEIKAFDQNLYKVLGRTIGLMLYNILI